MVGFDEYERKARLVPGLLAGLPLAFLVVALGWNGFPVVSVASSLATAAGGTYLLAVLVRDKGRGLEVALWKEWGGPPTTQLLRCRDTQDSVDQRNAWRTAVAALTSVELLSCEEEKVDPPRADERIGVAVRQLLHHGRGTSEHRAVHVENIAYGFERNLYALRQIARGLALTCVVTIGLYLIVDSSARGGAVVAGLVVEVACLVGWMVAPSKDRIADAADRYAVLLLDAAITENRKETAS